MLALHRQPRRIEGRGVQLSLLGPVGLFVFIFFSARLHAQQTRSTPSSFTSRLINLEATAKETFRFNASLYNGRPRSGIYELHAAAPNGWNTVFRVDGMQLTSFRVDSNKTQDISIEITPGPEVKPGKYPIPVTARTERDTLLLNLEAVVKGSYALELSTPTGLLSDEITEGSRKPIHLTLKNAGTLPLDGLEMAGQSPSKWDVTFEPSKIERLDPGKTMDVTANLHVPDKTIAGDYVTTFTARNNSANANAAFRMTVTTSWLAGWVGVLVLLAAVGIIYYLIRKYGRR
jgi:uncharacterized membrane protein